MRRTHAGNTSGHNLRAFGNELRKQLHVFVVDVVDPLHTKLADLLAPVILLLHCHDIYSTSGICSAWLGPRRSPPSARERPRRAARFSRWTLILSSLLVSSSRRTVRYLMTASRTRKR